MSITISDLGGTSGGGQSFKFANIGDKIEGTIVGNPTAREQENRFTGRTETVIPIPLDNGDENGPWTIWPRTIPHSFLAGAIADALREAGAAALEPGGRLAVEYVGDQDTGRGNPAKVYKARYTPPAPAKVDDGDFF